MKPGLTIAALVIVADVVQLAALVIVGGWILHNTFSHPSLIETGASGPGTDGVHRKDALNLTQRVGESFGALAGPRSTNGAESVPGTGGPVRSAP
jgi:hypothetical protein